jgi:hypothetical protein
MPGALTPMPATLTRARFVVMILVNTWTNVTFVEALEPWGVPIPWPRIMMPMPLAMTVLALCTAAWWTWRAILSLRQMWRTSLASSGHAQDVQIPLISLTILQAPMIVCVGHPCCSQIVVLKDVLGRHSYNVISSMATILSSVVAVYKDGLLQFREIILSMLSELREVVLEAVLVHGLLVFFT